MIAAICFVRVAFLPPIFVVAYCELMHRIKHLPYMTGFAAGTYSKVSGIGFICGTIDGSRTQGFAGTTVT